MTKPKIITKEDYDDFFTAWVMEAASKIDFKCIEEITVTAGPWRSYGLEYSLSKDNPRKCNIDFYSALRNGFGSLSGKEVEQALQEADDKCNVSFQ